MPKHRVKNTESCQEKSQLTHKSRHIRMPSHCPVESSMEWWCFQAPKVQTASQECYARQSYLLQMMEKQGHLFQGQPGSGCPWLSSRWYRRCIKEYRTPKRKKDSVIRIQERVHFMRGRHQQERTVNQPGLHTDGAERREQVCGQAEK